jgi:hypothetical protein
VPTIHAALPTEIERVRRHTLKGLKLGDLAVSEGALGGCDSIEYRVLVTLLFIINKGMYPQVEEMHPEGS